MKKYSPTDLASKYGLVCTIVAYKIKIKEAIEEGHVSKIAKRLREPEYLRG